MVVVFFVLFVVAGFYQVTAYYPMRWIRFALSLLGLLGTIVFFSLYILYIAGDTLGLQDLPWILKNSVVKDLVATAACMASCFALATALERRKRKVLEQFDTPQGFSTPESVARMVENGRQQMSQLQQKILAAETDWDMLFHFPALQDVRVPETGRFYELYRKLRDTESALNGENTTAIQARNFQRAARYAARAWTKADHNSRILGLSYLSTDKAKDAATALRLLPIVKEDSGASPAEQRAAFIQLERTARKLGFKALTINNLIDSAEQRGLLES
ncbi:MAG: hypothetical protein PT944_02860 [Actinomycetaceae bacterium]|nr:hypothetical protein [Arcanobacterium sp.]MDD7686844.1 hypothetical protein [Actinomycetaceae bacterium]MDY5274065.1 hypothetical protein [Arcanobacterium sp.]